MTALASQSFPHPLHFTTAPFTLFWSLGLCAHQLLNKAKLLSVLASIPHLHGVFIILMCSCISLLPPILMLTVHQSCGQLVIYSYLLIFGDLWCSLISLLCCKCGSWVFGFAVKLLYFYLEIWGKSKTVLPTAAAFVPGLTHQF